MADFLPDVLEEFVADHPGHTAREIQKMVLDGLRPMSRIQVALMRLVEEGKLGRVHGGPYRKGYLYYKRVDGDVSARTDVTNNP